jgi:uncharacterized repeat protein (TIGR03943 family)
VKGRFSIGEDAQGGLLTALGAMGVRLVVSRQFLRFIRPGMKFPLLAASALLLILGITTLIRAWRNPYGQDDDHDHDHAEPDVDSRLATAGGRGLAQVTTPGTPALDPTAYDHHDHAKPDVDSRLATAGGRGAAQVTTAGTPALDPTAYDHHDHAKPDVDSRLATAGGRGAAQVTTAGTPALDPTAYDHAELATDKTHAGHSHAEGKGPAVGWLLSLPLAVLLLIAPTSLGSFAASRQAVKTTRLAQAQNVDFDPLPEVVGGRVPLTLTDFSERGLYDSKESLKGIPVRLVGFVNHDKAAPGGFFLTRFKISCCAADAYPIQVVLHGDAGQWPDDTWLSVDGVWKPTEVAPDSQALLRGELTVQKVTKLTTTPDPYE